MAMRPGNQPEVWENGVRTDLAPMINIEFHRTDGTPYKRDTSLRCQWA